MVNRKARRAARAFARAEEREHARRRRVPAHKEGPPPGYTALVHRMVELTEKWLATEPGLPDLKWHEPDGVAFIAPLQGKALDYLAASPDARRLCEWLDLQTGCEATLRQMTIVCQWRGWLSDTTGTLERHRKAATSHTSRGVEILEAFARQTGTTTDTPESPCPHCGVVMQAASGITGHVPSPGDFAVCVRCGGINCFDEALGLLPFDALDSLDEARRDHLLEMQALIRTGRMADAMHAKKRPAPEA